jgi:pyruvate/2-oxoglutarate dehydrogenase complex dihydrolipoamide dehydrogenase (E3) component
MERYNLIIIGAGSGGLTVAVIAASLGARVALLEKHRPGGDCLNYGCVPSKALLKLAKVAYTIRTASDYGLTGASPLPPQDLKSVMDYVRDVQGRIAPHDSAERLTELGVEVILGSARLRSPHEVEVADSERRLWGRHIVLASGSRPRIPAIRGLEEVGFLTNETVFDCDTLPISLLVIGGGPIGTELGQAFARLGSQVTIVSASDHVLPREDADVAEALARQLRNEGVSIWDRSRALWAAADNGKKRVGVLTPGGERVVDVDEILVAAGRQPNTHEHGLEEVGVIFDERGVRTDRRCRTNVPSVWAVGDVAGPPFFSHWASYQVRVVARNALFPGSSRCAYDALPWTTFTQPEVARVGMSEAEAQARSIPYDVFKAPFTDNDRAVCDGEGEGFAKVLTRKGTGRILGAAIVHARAGELRAELTVAKKHGLPLSKLSSAIHVYPTLSEVHRTVGDTYLLQRITPTLRKLLTAMFSWLRRGKLLFVAVFSLLFPGFSWALSPLVAELQTVAVSYHEDPTRLDQISQGLEQAIKSDPDPANLVALARVSFIWGDIRSTDRDQKLRAYDRGRQVGKRAVELDPRNPQAHFWYAINTARWGQTKGIVRSLFLLPTVEAEIQLILDLDPEFTAVYALAGNVFYEVPGVLGGGLHKAEAMFRKGLEQDPRFTAMRVGLGKTLLKLGHPAEAKREFQSVLNEQMPSNPADWTLRDTKEARELLASISGKS